MVSLLPARSAAKQETTSDFRTSRKRSRATSDDAHPKRSRRRAVNGTQVNSIAAADTPGAPPTASSTRSLPAQSTSPLQVFVFGEGPNGELGLGTGTGTTVAKTPRLNPSLSQITSCAVGGMHAVAVASGNRLLTWGINDDGALGRDTEWHGNLVDINADQESDGSSAEDDQGSGVNPKEATPTEVDPNSFPTGTKFVQVTAGDCTSFVLTDKGHVHGWGTFRDHNGVYGFTFDASKPQKDRIVEHQRRPMRIPGLERITQISAGADFALALDSKGQVFAWGCGQQCELGQPIGERYRPKALLPNLVRFPRKTKIRSIHAATNHAFAIDQHGDTWSWGLNNFGQTGIPSSAGQAEAIVAVPTRVTNLIGRKMHMISGGLHHSIGLSSDGECLVWGRLDGDQMGLDVKALLNDSPASVLQDEYGRPRCLLQPTPLPIPQCQYIAAGSDHCLAVTSDGKAYSWGFNATYQCGQPTDDDVKVATLLAGEAILDANIVWAGAGGQYSMLAATMKKETTV